jgi:hypothetical protein
MYKFYQNLAAIYLELSGRDTQNLLDILFELLVDTFVNLGYSCCVACCRILSTHCGLIEHIFGMAAMQSTPAPRGQGLTLQHFVYFMHLGAKSTLAEFMWNVKSAFHEYMVDITCMSQCFHEDRMYYFVEFSSMEGMNVFLVHMGNHALKGEKGAIYLPFTNLDKGPVVVTLTGVHSTTEDADIMSKLSQYGEPNAIVLGSHWIGTEMYNGKRYIVFEDGVIGDIPPRLDIGGNIVLVQYPNQPRACFTCGSLLHLSHSRKAGDMKPRTWAYNHGSDNLVMANDSRHIIEFSPVVDRENEECGSPAYDIAANRTETMYSSHMYSHGCHSTSASADSCVNTDDITLHQTLSADTATVSTNTDIA